MVFCEAAGHGVVAARVARRRHPLGRPRGRQRGCSSSVDAPAEDYADYLWCLLEDRRRYEALAIRAFDEYQRVLSWDAQARRVGSRLAGIV